MSNLSLTKSFLISIGFLIAGAVLFFLNVDFTGSTEVESSTVLISLSVALLSAGCISFIALVIRYFSK
jgi:hypothetical protein